MKKSGAIIILVIVVVLAAAAFFITRKSPSKSAATTTANTTSPSAANSPATSPNPSTPVAATITYSNSGFSPSKVTVKAGDTVSIKNASDQDMQFDSDPHPVHTDDPELNVGTVSSGQTMTFTATKKGTFGYHNHLNPSDKGTIVVQ